MGSLSESDINVDVLAAEKDWKWEASGSLFSVFWVITSFVCKSPGEKDCTFKGTIIWYVT